VFRFDLPAGSYLGTLQPAHVLGSYSAAAFEVDVVEGAVTPLRVETGGGATLRLRLPLVDEMPSSMLSIRAVGERDHKVAGGSTDLSQEQDQILRGERLVWTGFLPGTWKLELHWDGEILERTVTLAEGDDHLVSFR
jgi:hypothetical protein